LGYSSSIIFVDFIFSPVPGLRIQHPVSRTTPRRRKKKENARLGVEKVSLSVERETRSMVSYPFKRTLALSQALISLLLKL
jgi:hypothetical protein